MHGSGSVVATVEPDALDMPGVELRALGCTDFSCEAGPSNVCSEPEPTACAARSAFEHMHALRCGPVPVGPNAKTCSSLPLTTVAALASERNPPLSILAIREQLARSAVQAYRRAILPTEYARLQRMTGQMFTVDACCKPASASGSDSCPSVSPTPGLLTSDFGGQHAWLHAPPSLLGDLIHSYQHSKTRRPHDTSACILVPNQYGAKAATWRPLLQGMRLLHTYQKGSVLFADPHAPRDQPFKLQPGISCDMQVWYDPPTVPLYVNAVADAPDSLTMSFPGTVDASSCRVLVDSGAKGHAFVSWAFAKEMGLHVNPFAAVRYRVADDRTAFTHGVATLRLRLASCEFALECHVIDMLSGYDVILGDAWLLAHRAYLDYARGACVFSLGGKRVVLQSRNILRGRHAVSADSSSELRMLISAIDWQNMLNAPATSSDSIAEMHLLVVKPLTSETPTPDLPLDSPLRLDPSKLQALLDEHKSFLVDDLPAGLPDLLLDQEVIPLEPGATPPCARIWRHSQLEQQEVEKHVTALLEKGLLRPSTAPYGAPILFVRKKDGSLRMCIDYRGINRITVKNKYPLPRIDDLLDRLQGARVFSSLDLTSAYHQIRLVDSDVPKTTFRCHLGAFSYLVLPFGLSNACSHFSMALSTVLGGKSTAEEAPDRYGESLRDFVCVYLDDILVFSKSAEDHMRHLRVVLQRLQKHRFYVKLKKCEFNKPEVKFLGHIVSADGVRPDPDKIKAILDWPVPGDVSALRSFLGLANYFRKFVLHYSQIVAPLTDMLRMSEWPAVMPEPALHAFDRIKAALTSAPCLALADFSKPFEVICDASGKGIGAILMQDNHPVAFESRKLTDAERKWTTTEQELLAVVHAFKIWRCYLEGAKGVTVITDHCPLTFFSTQPMLSRRQARWSEYLHQFQFKWQYRPGRINAADPLSRHPNLSVAAIYCAALSTAGKADGMLLPDAAHADIEKRIQDAYAADPWFRDSHNLADLTARKGYWLKHGRIVVPATGDLRYECIRLCHDAPWAAHPGVTKTLKALERYFWWPSMRADVQQYVRVCDSCQRVKPRNDYPAGLLMPLPIPDRPWESISMDFITSLPTTPAGHDTIMVVVDRFTKLAHFVPMRETTNALGVAELVREQIFRLHGVPANIVSDRDSRFTSEFWKALCAALGVAQRMSTAFHPESDGQTERVNRVLEDMLRHYVSPDQTNWADLLCMAEFAYNSAWHESIQNTPFYLTYGYHPHSPLTRLLHNFDPSAGKVMAVAAIQLGGKAAKRKALHALMQRVPALDRFTVSMQDALVKAKRALQGARERMKRFADQRRTPVTISVGDKVMLSSKNIDFKSGGSRKLLPRWIGPFQVTEQINPVAFKLDLSELSGRLHPVFHASLLRPYHSDGRAVVQPAPLPVHGELEYEVDSIIRKYYNRAGKLFYVVRWKGYGPECDTREPASDLTNCPDVLREFHDAERRGLAPPAEYAPGSRALKRQAQQTMSDGSDDSLVTVPTQPSTPVAAPAPAARRTQRSKPAAVRNEALPIRTRAGRSVKLPAKYSAAD